MKTVILSGGSGTRMWPLSRELMPKQFVKFNEEGSLFQKTMQRNLKLSDSVMIVSNISQKNLVLDQVSQFNIPNKSYIWESKGKNSAYAIIMAALYSKEDEILCVVPSDHIIKDQLEYESSLVKAKQLAQNNNIVAIGIKPTFAATGYGYISHRDGDIHSFIEKPQQELAESFLASGDYLWNGGIYCFKAAHFLNECKRIIPDFFEQVKHSFTQSKITDTECTLLEASCESIEPISIDNALMEKLELNFKVVPLYSSWDDMGSFDAVNNNNFIKDDKKNIISIESSNNCIIPSSRMIATLNVDNLIIVDTPDALLITSKGNSQGVKKVVKELQLRNSSLTKEPSTVTRPWGTYTVLENTQHYKTKKIVVKAKQRLSLQSHYHRNEHWIVVSGMARVTIGETTKLLQANESTYIPAGEKHRLENPGLIDLIMIEAQVGEYLEEDDIVRYEDDYNRTA